MLSHLVGFVVGFAVGFAVVFVLMFVVESELSGLRGEGSLSVVMDEGDDGRDVRR